MGEDAVLEFPQCRGRLDPELLAEDAARLLVGPQRLGLAPGSVQGEHELAPEPLAEWMFCNEALEFDRGGVVLT